MPFSNISTFNLADAGSNFLGQQVGNIWKGDNLVSLSLSGDLNYLDPSTSKASRVIQVRKITQLYICICICKRVLTSTPELPIQIGSSKGNYCFHNFGGQEDVLVG
jgi:hypothetical protein